MKERHSTGRENQTKHQQKLNNLKPKYRINHKITRVTLKCYPVRKLKRKQTGYWILDWMACPPPPPSPQFFFQAWK